MPLGAQETRHWSTPALNEDTARLAQPTTVSLRLGPRNEDFPATLASLQKVTSLSAARIGVATQWPVGARCDMQPLPVWAYWSSLGGASARPRDCSIGTRPARWHEAHGRLLDLGDREREAVALGRRARVRFEGFGEWVRAPAQR